MAHIRSVAIALALMAGLGAQVSVRPSTLALPGYEEGPPGENPPFELFNTGEQPNYPYTLRKNFTNTKEKKTWRTLEIENEYLKCIVLPDLGGRIYSCVDKIANREMFYANTTLKKADIGPRGAWIAAGTEFVFPAGHSWVNVSPVDFAIAKNPGGGASIFVANTDRVQATRWQVEITLRPGSTALEESITLSNTSAARRRYYWWNNAAVEAHDDTRFYYPAYLVATHGRAEIDSWPVNAKGVDMSRLENHTGGGVARFVYECREPFMGIYSRQAGGGVIHYADAAEVPGKKLWSWGAGDAGRKASKMLADDGTIYVEMQAGLFQDQESWGFLEPQESRRFTEYWMPARGLGGISRANLDAAVYMERAGAELKLGLNVTHALPNARIRVLDGAKVVHEERASLDPRRTFERSVAAASKTALTFELYDTAGKRLMTHTEGVYNAAKASETILGVRQHEARKKDRTEREFIETAVDHESNGRLLAAAGAYDEGLRVFPESAPLNIGAGRTAVALKRYERAVSYLVKGARLDDIEPHYYLGVAYARMGDDAKARWQFERAREDRGVGVAASLELAQLLSRRGDRAGALRTARWAIANLPASVEMGALEAALLRASGKEDVARTRIERWLKLDPANSLARYERVRDGATDDALWRHLGAGSDRVLDVAAFYMAAGLWADALDVLSRQFPAPGPQETELGAAAPQDHPLVAYYRGYARQKLGQPAREDFAKAARQSTRYVFPDRAETLAVLQAALKEDPSDATAHYLLGLWYLSSGSPEPAIREWQRAFDLHADVPGLPAILAEAKKKSPLAAPPAVEAGIRVDSQKQITPAEKPQAQPKAPLKAQPDSPKQTAARALALLESGRADEAAQVFNATNFPQEKQTGEVREAFIETRLGRILDRARTRRCPEALAAIEAIGDEDPSLPFSMYAFGGVLKSTRIEYELGLAEAACGEDRAARKRWSRIAKHAGRTPSPDTAYALLAAHKLGEADDAELRAALDRARKSGSTAEMAYTAGLLERALGQTQEAANSFRAAVEHAGDNIMLRHLAQMALAEH